MTQIDNGFTMMETLVAIAITLVCTGVLTVSFSTGIKGASRGIRSARTAAMIAQTDRFIRRETDDMHIPYWAKPDFYLENHTKNLMRSIIGGYITSVTPAYDTRRRIRGITVNYRIYNQDMQTTALFPATPVLER
jgi:prepilin-type N-terminal cleavage/methylation domain-containing protein